MKMNSRLRWSDTTMIVFSALWIFVWGCGDDVASGDVGHDSTTVGGPCESHSDCDERCLLDDFPGGMCTLTCESHDDCPPGSACMDIQSGVCLLECESDDDCPGDYECDDEDGFGPRGGEVDVCLED